MEAESQECALSLLDLHFGDFVARFAAGDEKVFLAAALVSMATRGGHSCMDLREWAGRGPLWVAGQERVAPELDSWCAALAWGGGVGSGGGNTPLVLEGGRLYLRRYWGYEEEVAGGLLARGRAVCLPVDDKILAAGLARWFPPDPDGADAEQRLAALVAMLRPLAVITGGPGTGKTTAVASILALLGEQYLARGCHPRIALAAPTGKAAMRLQGSLSRLKKLHQLGDQLAGVIPEEVLTMHRLLGAITGSASFRYDENNPLPYDLVVVDEVSMVDLPLMAKLFRALRPETRLIILGDRHQLASVEPGSVLGDLCHPAVLAAFSGEFARRIEGFEALHAPALPRAEAFGLADSLVELRRSHRFAATSGIGRLGALVKAGDAAGAWEVLAGAAFPDVLWREVSSSDQLESLLSGLIPPEFAGLPAMAPAEALAVSEGFRVLCVVRQGDFGAERLNARFEGLLERQGYLVAAGRNYPGRPIMILRNDYDLRLYNGDVGVMLPDQAENGELRAYFPGPSGDFRKVSPSRLPPYQSVYAMTVHKSQGSEFERVILVLPERHTPVLSRELLFTAITRARARVEIWGRRQIFEQAVAVVAERHSGLRLKLWGDLAAAER